MRRNPRLFRLSASVALAALLGNAMLPVTPAARAQPPQPAQTPPDRNGGDPPERVGRIAELSGPVSWRTGGDTQWTAASLNYPVSSGYAFWTEPSAITGIEVSASRVVLAGGTEFDVTALDAGGLHAVAAQGETYLHLRDLAPDEVWSVQTPRGMVRLSGAGRYGIAAGTTGQPTLITVLDGTAEIQGPNLSLQVSANQTATIVGTDNYLGSIGPAQRDAFLDARLAAERPPQRIQAAIPRQVSVMPGGAELVESGSWSAAPEYGQVWYPPVSPGWVPYRHGHWAYVAPWGWTWVDDASWGFAPFHYGRWVQLEGRWAWTPGEAVVAGPPVYAPALVAFIGIGAGVAIGAAVAAGSIGWVPLGPHEVYHPWYHASDAYVRQVNISHVTNVQTINNTNVTVNNFVNRGAATQVPAAAMAGSRPIQAVAQPVTPDQFAAARPVTGQQPLSPTAATSGVTPAVARHLNLSPSGVPAHPPAPGPAVQAGASEPGFQPPLIGHRAAGAETPAPREPATGGPAGPPPHPGAVPLAEPGARPAGLPPTQTAHIQGAEQGAGSGPRVAHPFAAAPGNNHLPPIGGETSHPGAIAPAENHPAAVGPGATHPATLATAPNHPAAVAPLPNHPQAHASPAVTRQPAADAPRAAAPRTAFAAPAVHAAAAALPAARAAAPAPHGEPAQHHEKRPGER
nr:DUF6600 domain-containing protein [uncultured Rhodopila sp.]